MDGQISNNSIDDVKSVTARCKCDVSYEGIDECIMTHATRVASALSAAHSLA